MADNGGGSESARVLPAMAKIKPVLILTISAHILSLPILGAGIWLVCMRDCDCEDLLRTPRLRIAMGVAMIIIFVASNAAVIYGSRWLLPSYLSVMFCSILLLTMGLAFVGAYKAESRAVPASPMWLRKKVNSNENWNNIKACIFESRICKDLGFRTIALSYYDFNAKKLSLMESGCCKPPSICGMEYVNATFWKTAKKNSSDVSKDMLPYYDGDCVKWSNDENQLCYDCETCKAGFLHTLNQRWWRLGVFLVFMVVSFSLIHSIRFVALMWMNNNGS